MRILFICPNNSIRSQMAEALAHQLFNKKAEVMSCGSHPEPIHPLTIAALKKVGIDISTAKSRSPRELPPFFLTKLNFVIGVCTEDVAPISLSSAKQLSWSIPDPSGIQGTEEQKLAAFEKTREQIREQILIWGKRNMLIASSSN